MKHFCILSGMTHGMNKASVLSLRVTLLSGVCVFVCTKQDSLQSGNDSLCGCETRKYIRKLDASRHAPSVCCRFSLLM